MGRSLATGKRSVLATSHRGTLPKKEPILNYLEQHGWEQFEQSSLPSRNILQFRKNERAIALVFVELTAPPPPSERHAFCYGVKRFGSDFFDEYVGWGIVISDGQQRQVETISGLAIGRTDESAEFWALTSAIKWGNQHPEAQLHIYTGNLHFRNISGLKAYKGVVPKLASKPFG